MMVQILDSEGAEQDWNWLTAKYGLVDHRFSATAQYELVKLQELEGPSSMTVTVLDEKGNPKQGVDVCFSWQDAPANLAFGWDGKAVIGTTNETGSVGFGLGPGAFYSINEKGPHSVWIKGVGVSDYIGGLGWPEGSNHRHLEPTFRKIGTTPEPDPDPEPEPEPLPPTDDERWGLAYIKMNYIISLLEKKCANS